MLLPGFAPVTSGELIADSRPWHGVCAEREHSSSVAPQKSDLEKVAGIVSMFKSQIETASIGFSNSFRVFPRP